MAGDAPLIALDRVFKGFGAGERRVEPLRGVSLDVRAGETLVIIGPSGTGKSVALRLMIGLLDPDGGRVLFEGRDLASFSAAGLDAMRRRMSMLFQSGALFDSMTVGENVAYPLRIQGERDEAKMAGLVAKKLAQVGLPGVEEKMPSELSGGMRKRAALARSIVADPEVIFYDEPTTGLDPIMSDAIADLIRDTRDKLAHVTSLVVTHDMPLAFKIADRIVMLNQGVVVGDAPPEEFRRLGEGGEPAKDLPPEKRMIRQFVRGEADGPIQVVEPARRG